MNNGGNAKYEKYMSEVLPEDKTLVGNVMEVLYETMKGKLGTVRRDVSCKKINSGYELELPLEPPCEGEDILVRYDDFVNIWEVSQVRVRDVGIRVNTGKSFIFVIVLDHKQDLIVEDTTILRIRKKRKMMGLF